MDLLIRSSELSSAISPVAGTHTRVLVIGATHILYNTAQQALEDDGCSLAHTETLEQAFPLLHSGRWDVVLACLGSELNEDDIRRLLQFWPEIPVVVLTAAPSVQNAVRWVKRGAFDYLDAQSPPEQIAATVRAAASEARLRRQSMVAGDSFDELLRSVDLVGQAPAMQRVLEQVEALAAGDFPMLIVGARGTGKEMLARVIHARSVRAPMPFLVTRCGLIADDWLAEDLFGREIPGNPGAIQKGRLELADGGTLFVDEIGEAGPELQQRLCQLARDREIQRLGSKLRTSVNVRLIAASSRPLEPEVKAGKFDRELYQLLTAATVHLPRLCERREDIPLLVHHFLRKHAQAMNRPVPEISESAMRLLLEYDWPGNVRELDNAIERAMLMRPRGPLQPGDFPFQVGSSRENLLPLREVERLHILRVLEHVHGNISEAARILQIDRTTLYNKLRAYGLR